MELRDVLHGALGNSYSLQRELGGGGMSRVFLATETALGRSVVIKALPPELSHSVSTDRFTREIQVAAQLQHPHIVPVLAAGDADGVKYYTMPFVQGESLRAAIARGARLPVAQVVRVLREVAAAMAYAHKRGVVHRDIKPDNVLLSDGFAVVTDFGVAKALTASTGGDGHLTSLGVALGTPAYMAPEQAAAEPDVDHRADIYALGILAYELLTGATPFAGRPAAALLAAQITEAPEPLARHRPDVPAALASLVDRSLRKPRAERPQSADDVVRELDLIATTPAGTVAERAPMASSRRVGWWLAGAALAAAVVVGGTWTIIDPPSTDSQVIAVFPFRVSSADPSVSYLREGMQDLLAIKLSSDAGMRTTDVRAVLAALRGAGSEDVPPEQMTEIAGRLGAGQVLRGEVVGTAGRVVIRATLTPLNGADVNATVQGSADSVSLLVDALAAQLLARRARESEARMPTLSATSLPVLRAYLDGQAAYRRGTYTQAYDHFRRALEMDATFAPAALGGAAAAAWGAGNVLRDSLRALAWAMRDRLTAVDRLRMEAEFGIRTPGFTPATEHIAAAERFVAAAPDNIEAWHQLGDIYFHMGAEVGMADHMALAARAFDRALAIDSTFWPSAEHLPVIRHELGDTAGRRAAAEHLWALDSTNGRARTAAWVQAAASAAERGAPPPDSAGISAINLAIQSVVDHGIHPRSAQALHDEYVVLERGLATAARRRGASGYRRNFESHFGHLTHVAVTDSLASDMQPHRLHAIWNALFADGDTMPAARVAETSRRRLRDAIAELPLDNGVYERSGLALWLASRGSPDDVQPVLATLREIASLPDTVRASAAARLMTLTVEAMLADRANAPDKRNALARLDSLARTAPAPALYIAAANLVAARLWERQGRLDLALAATRRRQHGMGLYPFVATQLREQGRLAEATGDREGAIRAYRHYLVLRYDPDPPLREEARQIAERLARLERASAGR